MNTLATKIKLTFATLVLTLALPVSTFAMPIFIGSFDTNSGPSWGSNPDVYSAVEAAALLFGGLPAEYRISTDASQDVNTITDTGWYSIIGVSGGHEFADDFSQDLGGSGYGATGWARNDDISAYVRDNAYGGNFINYVWRDNNVAQVAEPATLALLGMGLLGLGVARRRK